MYWRVRKISPDQVLKTYGVYAVAVVSVIANLIMFSKVAPSKALNAEQKTNFDTFARNVTRHVLDGCFVTYEASMYQLYMNGTKAELAPPVIQALAQAEVIPNTPDNMKAVARQLKESKSVSQISIDDVKIDEPNGQGLVPIEVGGRVVKHSAEGLQGPDPFRFRYLVGMRGGENPAPAVTDFRDISNQPTQQAQ